MTYEDQLALIDDRSAALRDAVAAAPDLAARVPGCPDWELRDLVQHLGAVQRFWAAAVTAADPAGPPAWVDQDVEGDLLAWFAESTGLLLDALRAAGPSSPCWAWWTSAPHTAGAVARHQVQEAAVHAWDAQETAGRPAPLPRPVAADGLPEFLTVALASLGAWPHTPATVKFAPTDAPAQTVELTPSGARLVPDADPTVTVEGASGEMILALYGRRPWTDLKLDGDRSVLTTLRQWSKQD